MQGRRRAVWAVFLWWAAALAAWAMSSEQEVKIGREVAVEIEKEYRVTSNREWQAQIEEIGRKLVEVGSRKDIEYRFKVLDMGKELNAFALPGGFIYFSERLWKYMTVDERASVLAHELAHVTQRHWARRVDKETKKNIALILLDLVLKPNVDIARAMSYASDFMSLHYSRGDEREADERGLAFMYAAGYNPWGFVTAMQKLKQLTGDFPREVKFLSSHPLTADRIKTAQARVEAMNVPKPEPGPPPAPPVTEMPEAEKAVIDVRDFAVRGDYGGSGAESGIADMTARELSRSGQAYVTRNGQPVPGAEALPAGLGSRRRLSLSGRAAFSVEKGDLTNAAGKAALALKLEWQLYEGGRLVRQGETTCIREGRPGTAPAAPWVSGGRYDGPVLQSLAGGGSLHAVRLALRELVAYPHLLQGPAIASVNARRKTVTLDAPPDSVSPGDRYEVRKPLGDFKLDPRTGALDSREIVTVAVLEVSEISPKGVTARASLRKGYGMGNLKPGDKTTATE